VGKKKSDTTTELIDQFLGSFDYDQVELDDWIACHECLDVQVTARVPRDQLVETSIVTVEFCQVTHELNHENRYAAIKTLKMLQVKVPKGTVHLEKIIVNDQGDSKDGRIGRLIVTIHAT
jgi:hypothetical protein